MQIRHFVRSTAALLAALSTVCLTGGIADAHGGGLERMLEKRSEYRSGLAIPSVLDPKVHFVTTFPDTAGISGCFAKSAPYFYMSSIDTVSVYDVSNPLSPSLVGVLDNVVFENEAMNCGERRHPDGTVDRFVLIGNDLADASSTDIDHTSGSVGGNELIVIDVTDPTDPHIRSRVSTETSTHTVTCVRLGACTKAYSAGDSGHFSIVDLRNLDAPVEVDSDRRTAGVQPFASPTAGHKWNFDGSGFGAHTGYDGTSIWNVTRPQRPVLVTTTGRAGRGENPDGTPNGYNDFIHHNSLRPNASAFKPNSPPSFANGNVMLVTEEDYEDVNASTAGSFQTWHVKTLDGTPDAIVPLDKVELADLGTFPLPAGAFVSAHWFDYHPSGLVAAGFYGGGLQVIDVRNPTDITTYGSALWGASEVWDAYWVPGYKANGRPTGQKTNVVYTVDLVRGLDVYTVDLPGTPASPAGVAAATFTVDESSALPVLPVGAVVLAGALALVIRRRSTFTPGVA